MLRTLTAEQADRVWDILVEEVGADPDKTGWRYESFVQYLGMDVSPHCIGSCHEYRFEGNLGHGGKFRHDTSGSGSVSCYPENRTPNSEAAIERANQRLSELYQSWGYRGYRY